MNIISRIFNSIYDMLVILAKILLVGMVIIVSAAVFARFVLNSGIKWSDEVALITMVWFTFIGLLIGVRRHLHINIEIIATLLPENINKVLNKFVNLVCVFLGVIMVIYGVKLVQYTATSTLPATGLPSAVLYAILPISAIFITYYSLLMLLGLEKYVNEDEQGIDEGGRENA